MADNTVLNTGTGGDTIRDKDRSGVKTPIVALDLNPAGTETLMAGVMPVSNAGTFATQATLQAGANLIGRTAASDETSTVYSGTTALTPKFAKIVASASGATTIVAAVASKKIRVLRWSLSASGNVNVKWQSRVAPTDLTGLHYLTQYASAGGAYCPAGIFETVAGEALDINLSAAIAVGGELTYVEV
jgi:hypothetical protein